jgi:hypothetical protein
MGHYDSAYEFEAEKRSEERAADARLFLHDIEKLQLLAEGPVDLPQRFRDALTDMKNWVMVSVPGLADRPGKR